MKKNLHRTCGALLLAMAALLASGCEEKVAVDVHLTYETEHDALVNADLGLDYRFASVSYEPAFIGDPWADWDDILFCTVEGYAPEDLLTEEWTGVGSMLYAADKPLPALAEMDCDKIMVCQSSTTTTCLFEVTEEDIVAEAVRCLTEGEAVTLPENGDESFSMKFCSEEYAGIYYNVVYIAVGQGENTKPYLYDRGEKKCVALPYALFDGIMYAEDEEAVTANPGISLGEGEEIEIGFGDQ